MEGGRKANKPLAAELAALRERVRELEALQAGRKAIETELNGARQRYQHLLAVSPAIIYTTHASGDFACTFVSENIRTIMGFSPEEMTTDPKCWPDRLHPDDAPRVFNELAPLIEQGGGAVEYRFRHRDSSYRWVRDEQILIRHPGQPDEVIGSWSDVTERKEAELRLHDSEEKQADNDATPVHSTARLKSRTKGKSTWKEKALRHLVRHRSERRWSNSKSASNIEPRSGQRARPAGIECQVEQVSSNSGARRERKSSNWECVKA